MFPPTEPTDRMDFACVGLVTLWLAGFLIFFGRRAWQGKFRSPAAAPGTDLRHDKGVAVVLFAFAVVLVVAIASGLKHEFTTKAEYRFNAVDVVRISVRRLDPKHNDPTGPTVTIDDPLILAGLAALESSTPAHFRDREWPLGGYELRLHMNDGTSRLIRLSSRTNMATGYHHVEGRLETRGSMGIFKNSAIHQWFSEHVYPRLDSLDSP